jgi:hypothetical protein
MPSSKPQVARQPNLPSSLLSLLTGWMQQGIESFSATQRIFEEVVIRQNAATAQSLENYIADSENSPVAILTELAVRGTSSFIEAQRILLHLAEKENQIAMNGVKERIVDSPGGVVVTDFVRRTLDTFLRMQQDFLKTTDKQITNWLEAVQQGGGHQGTQLVDLARNAMETFVHAQKKFLDVIADEAIRATSNKHRPLKRTKKTDLPKLADDATRSFVEAQQRLLEVVTQQMNINVNTTSRAMRLISPSCLLPMANITGENLSNFVGAEKTLLDAMTKPGRGSQARSTAARQRSRSVRPRERVHAARASG